MAAINEGGSGSPQEFSCDESALPVVIVRMPARWQSSTQLREALERMQACHRHPELAFVIDVRGSARPDGEQRGIIAEAIRQRHRAGTGQLRAIAVVSTSPSLVARGIFLALEWLAPVKVPIEHFEERELAIAWASTHTTKTAASVTRDG